MYNSISSKFSTFDLSLAVRKLLEATGFHFKRKVLEPQTIEARYAIKVEQSSSTGASACRLESSLYCEDEVVTVKEGDLIPFNGEVIDGCALVDESAVVGVSSPVLLSTDTGRNNVVEGGLIVEGNLSIKRSMCSGDFHK